jgi:hypothetical protein
MATKTRTATRVDHAAVFREACEAGERASRAAEPTPMIVGNAIGLSDRIDPNGPLHYVAGGACGFAGVVISDGRSGFARWLRSQRIGYRHYYGGHYVPARPQWSQRSPLMQSVDINAAYAAGFANVARSYGIDCYVDSRLD